MNNESEILTDWEKTTCSRCGGSGQHSYCQMYGSTCFKCGGAKKVLTKRAQVALAALREARQVLVTEIAVGMKVKVDWIGFPGAATTPAVCNVIEVESKTDSNGNPYVMVVVERKNGQQLGIQSWPTSKMERIPNTETERAEQVRKFVAYQNMLTKTGKLRKASRIESEAA